MKFFDKLLRSWRVSAALKALPGQPMAVFDIGCGDGYLLKRVKGYPRLDGCDPRLPEPVLDAPGLNLFKGCFPAAAEQGGACLNGGYDAVFALAVFEHFPEEDLAEAARVISLMLSDAGVLIVTVPHPLVDRILDALLFLKLIDGQAVEEHHGFDAAALPGLLSRHLEMVCSRRFQFGLNNLFVFRKRAARATD